MNMESDSPARDAGRFHTTHWTVVLRAAQSQAPGGQAALAQLCRLYWYPLYGFVRYRGYSPDDAQDLTQGFLHRDLKPGNIMVSLEDGGALSAKIIDLGLAKPVEDPGSQITLSTPGAFVGTPEFASPEQCAGLPVDIRSDLYSLGATLWKMLTGQPPFRGTFDEVIHQHLHVPVATGRVGSRCDGDHLQGARR